MNQRQNQATAENRNTRRIAFVQACWHKDIVDQCRVSFTAEIVKHGFGDGDIDFFEVPGSLEIPLHALLLAQSGRYAAIGLPPGSSSMAASTGTRSIGPFCRARDFAVHLDPRQRVVTKNLPARFCDGRIIKRPDI
jgi:hypothetical protein